jgi:pilus assembly protein CpaE
VSISGVPRAAVVSTDSQFRELARQILSGPERSLAIELELAVPFDAMGEQQLHAIRSQAPEVILLDMEDAPDLALRFAQFLIDQNPALVFLAVGPVLSSDQLLAAMRAGVTEYLPKPVDPDELRGAAMRASQKLRKPSGDQSRQAGKILAFFSPKGGGGSTTLATNLAIVVHRTTQKRTLLVDLDLEMGESALVLGVQPRFNFVDFVENFRRMDAGLLASYIERHDSGVHLLSAPFQPEKAEAVTADQIRRILSFLRQHYDYIIVDTPRSFAPPILAVFEQADQVYIVSTVDLPSLRNIQRGYPLLKRVLTGGPDQLRLVLNRYNPGDSISPSDVERSLGLKVFWKVSNDYEAVMGSVNSGKPIVLNGGRSNYTNDVRGLAAAVTGVKSVGKGGRGPLGRLSASVRSVLTRNGKKSEGA